MAAFVGAFALFATPAEAGGRRHYKNYYNGDCYRGGGYRGGYGYYGYYRTADMGIIARCVIIDPHTTTRHRPFRSASPLAAAATAAKPHDNSVGGLKAPERTDSGAF